MLGVLVLIISATLKGLLITFEGNISWFILKGRFCSRFFNTLIVFVKFCFLLVKHISAHVSRVTETS